jgi:chitinase
MYLSFNATAGGGTAKVGSTPLIATPTLFTAGTNGALQINYTAPSPLPSTGQDAIVVRDLGHSPTETNSDSYAFSKSTPVVSVGDVTVNEGDQNPGTPAEFTVTVSPAQPNPMTVEYRSLCGIGDKSCGEDFVQVVPPATLTIPANASSTTISVTQFAYVGAHTGETYNEGWFVELINPSVGVLGRSVGNGILLPDVEGSTVPLPLLYTGSAGVVPVTDATGVLLYFTVTLGAAEPRTVTFNYATTDGTALAGVNYAPTSGTASIPAGQTSTVVPVHLLPNAPPTSNKTFTLTISSATGGPTISRAIGTGTILAG